MSSFKDYWAVKLIKSFSSKDAKEQIIQAQELKRLEVDQPA